MVWSFCLLVGLCNGYDVYTCFCHFMCSEVSVVTTTHLPLLLFTVTCHRSQSKGALHVHRPHQATENPTL